MAIISNILLCNAPSLTTDYEHVINFSSVAEQRTYFNSKTIYDHSNINIQYDSDLPYVTIPRNIGTLWNVDYMMIENGGKHYYYFVTGRKFKAESSTILQLKLDVFQTYMFDYNFGKCFVIREHVADDTIGRHLVDEGIATGEYVITDQNRTNYFNHMCCVVQCTEDPFAEGDGTAMPKLIDGIPTGLNTYVIDNGTFMISNLILIINGFQSKGKLDSIVSIFMIPKGFLDLKVDDKVSDGIYLYSGNTRTQIFSTTVSRGIKDYTPRNNKLLTYPYTLMTVDNGQGNVGEFHFEFLNSIDFKCRVDLSPNSKSVIYPSSYKGIADNYQEKVMLDIGIMCGWTGNAYANYLASTQGSRIVNTLSGIGAVGAGIATGNPLAIGGGMLAIGSIIADSIDKRSLPNQAYGNTVSGNLDYSVNRLDFTFTGLSITQERARIIDDFFTMYGYKVNEFKIPNLNTRSDFNYIQMENINIRGEGIPKEHLQEIKNIYRNGTTIWHGSNGARVGYYEVENRSVVNE